MGLVSAILAHLGTHLPLFRQMVAAILWQKNPSIPATIAA